MIADGFIAGLLNPPSRVDKEMFGEKGNLLLSDAKTADRGALEEGRTPAKETVAAADCAVREAMDGTRDTARDTLASV